MLSGVDQAVDTSTSRNPTLWYLLGVVAVIVLALAGYVGYLLYPRFDLPPALGTGLLVLAAAAGIASFFSPCSFPLLVTLLARETDSSASGGQTRTRRAMLYAGSLAAGATGFLVAVALVIGLGGAAFFEGITFTSGTGRLIRLGVGLLLIVLGLMQLNVIRVSLYAVEESARPLLRKQAGLRRDRPAAGFALFGFGYLLAGFG